MAPSSGQPSRLGIDALPAGRDRHGPPAAGADVQVQPVLGGLALGDNLEPDARAGATWIGDAVRANPQIRLGHPNVAPIIIPGGEAGRRRLKLVPQRGGREAAQPVRISTVDH